MKVYESVHSFYYCEKFIFIIFQIILYSGCQATAIITHFIVVKSNLRKEGDHIHIQMIVY